MSLPDTKVANSDLPQFITRFHAARMLDRHPKTVADNEQRWGLTPIRINGQVSYTLESVEALIARWKEEGARRDATAPEGWRLLINAAKGPFIGEDIPLAPYLLAKSQEIEKLGGTERARRCIVSYRDLAEAFRVADAEGLNIISNGRGIVAVKEA